MRSFAIAVVARVAAACRRARRRASLAAMLPALLLSAAALAFDASDELFGGTFTVLTPSVVIGETARVEVQVFAGADFPLTLQWGDGTIDIVDNQPQPASYVLTHAYASPGIKLVQLTEGPPGDTSGFPETDVIEVRTPRLLLSGTTVAVGEPLRAEVDGAPVGGAVDWGDGTRTSLGDGGDVDAEHAYAATGTYVVQVQDAASNVYDVQVVTVGGAGGLRLSDTSVLVGERVVAEVSDAPNGATLEWGDGRRDVLAAGPARLEHAYAAAGAFVVRLLDPSGGLLELDTVAVTTGPLRFEVPALASVGLPLQVELEGLGANAPDGARIVWGDGSVEVVLGDGTTSYSYARRGTFLVRLEALPSGAPLSAAIVTVDATGVLASVGAARLFEPLRWRADDLAPGFAYELDLGDGTRLVEIADVGGQFEVEHTYATPLDSVVASLRLVEGGQRVLLDSVRVRFDLPDASETIAASVTPRPALGRFDVAVVADGLLDGFEYVVASPAVGVSALTIDEDGRGRAAFELVSATDQELTLSLFARIPRAQGGAVEALRAEAQLAVAWPRGRETLRVAADATPILVSDTVSIVAEGLVPGYAYELVVAGDDARPYRLGAAQDDVWSEIGRAHV